MQLTASSTHCALLLRMVGSPALVLLSTALSFAQVTPEPAEDVGELIERVEELQSFRATYRMHASDGRSGLMHWLYVADARAMRVHMETEDQSRNVFWIADGVMTASVMDDDGDEYFVGADVAALFAEYADVHDALDRDFPLATAGAFAPHIEFSLVLQADTDKVDFTAGIVGRRTCLLEWLPEFRDLEPVDQDDAQVFVFAMDSLTYEVSAVNGFLTRGWIGDEEDQRLALELVELELDVEIDGGDLQAPEWTESNEDLDKGFGDSMRHTLLLSTRSTALHRLQILRNLGELKWSEGGPNGLHAILRELHAVGSRHGTEIYLTQLAEHYAMNAETLQVWVDEHREDEDLQAQLERLIGQSRAQLDERLEGIMNAQIGLLRGPADDEVALEEAFLELEREVLREVLEETLRDVALKGFDETVGSVE